ncbi:MAG: SRPBCC family protein [Pseudomonadota bacterium]
MTQFILHSDWLFESRIEPVWEALHDVASWPEWWRYVRRVVELQPGDASGVGAVHRFTWSSRLPYTLSFDMRVTELDQPHRMAGVATGELEGTGIWTLNQEGPLARAHYEWRVRVTKPWMQLAAPLARPIFAWNHGQVMQAGGAGLARRLGVRRVG